jgi:excisionase family DNA binding protein
MAKTDPEEVGNALLSAQHRGYANLKETALILGLAHMTIQREISRGHLRAVKIGSYYKVTLDELDRYKTSGPMDPNLNPDFNPSVYLDEDKIK